MTLLSISPERGTLLGGTTLVISGINFPDSQTAQCIFGMTIHVCLRTGRPTTLCIAQHQKHQSIGQTTVQFSPNGVDIDTSQALIFTYDEETVLSSIWPSQGASSGGTLVKN